MARDEKNKQQGNAKHDYKRQVAIQQFTQCIQFLFRKTD